MTLLVREVGRFLLGSIAWVALAWGVTAAIGLGAAHMLRLPPRRTVVLAFIGGVAVAALAVRVHAPLLWSPEIGARPLPVGWCAIGAVGAVALLQWRRITDHSPNDSAATRG